MNPPDYDRRPELDDAPEDARAALAALRDSLRSARDWRLLLSEGDRRRMLADIALVALAIGRDLSPDGGLSDLDVGDPEGGGRAPADPCPRERLAFLEALWPRLSGALRRIEAAPPAALAHETRVVPAARARRAPPPAALMAALRTGDLAPAGAPALAGRLPAALAGRLPCRLAEGHSVPTHTTAENRAIKAVLVAWARDLAAINALAEVCGEPAVAERARRLRSRLRSVHLCRDPWRNMEPAAAVTPLNPAARNHDGAYRLVWDAWRRYRRGFAFDWSASSALFTLSSRETWRLYEVWCFLSVASALRESGWRCADADGLALLRGGLSFSLAPGSASRMVFARGAERVTLTYARRIPRAGQGVPRRAVDGDLRSRSHALTPDIILGYRGRLLILDAKFKAYVDAIGAFSDATLFPDLQQMHTYRDAVVGPGGQGGAVSGAWLLFCGGGASVGPEVVAFPESTAAEPFGDGLIGALRLRPGHAAGTARLCALLRGFLSERS